MRFMRRCLSPLLSSQILASLPAPQYQSGLLPEEWS